MAENAPIVRLVSILESSLNESEDTGEAPSISSAQRHYASNLGAENANHPNQEYFFPATTYSERLMRYLMVVIYLCGLCSVGFVLSIYHLFFWDSKMPPVYKANVPKKPFFVKP